MPRLAPSSGNHVNLTVTDLDRSVEWYARTFGLKVIGDESTILPASEEPMRYRSLGVPKTFSYVVGLIEHSRRATEPFDEHRTGLDHLALHVSERADLDEWAAHLDALGVEHSGIKTAEYAAVITLRDPDGIQLELFWADVDVWAALFIAAAD